MRLFLAMAFGVVFLSVGIAQPAHADMGPATLLKTYGDWSAYVFEEKGSKVCFVASSPKTAKGNYTRRGPVHAIFTHRPADKTMNTFSYRAGYDYDPKKDVIVKIDAQSFKLVPQGDTAWAPDQASDDALAAAFMKGSSMVVTGTSARGTFTTDTFGLRGTGDAMKRIGTECGVPAE